MSFSFFRTLFLGIACASMIGFIYHIFEKQQEFALQLHHIYQKNETIIPPSPLPPSSSVVIQAPSNVWLEVQKKAQDTVVQIFAQITHHNLVEPYKTPQQNESTGSGFFINDKGHIVTNYHVVNEATTLQIQIPSLGREQFDVEVVGVCPDRDVALLRLSEESYNELLKKKGSIPYLPLGNSDTVLKTHEILALGYPLLQQIVKSTQGIVSGREWVGGQSYIQMTAPINFGNSGGPALNTAGEVIGINTAGIVNAQNIGFVIPINEIKSTLNDLYKIPFLRKPTLGCIFVNATSELTRLLNNPGEGGWYIGKVFEGSVLEKAGIKTGDMLYAINGHDVDRFGHIKVDWSEDKVPALALFNRFVVGDTINLTIYRNGKKRECSILLESCTLQPIRQIYPLYEPITYEIVGGMVVMELTLNHIALMLEHAPFLMSYMKPENQIESRLIITHILPNSAAYKSRSVSSGAILEEVNGIKVRTLEDFRKAVLKPVKNEFFTFKCIDRAFDDLFVVLPLDKIVKEETILSQRFFYTKSNLISQLESLPGLIHDKEIQKTA